MTPALAPLALVLSLAATAAAAQPHGHRHGSHGAHGGGPTPSQPYAGAEARPIKALSDEQVADLRAGRGMGLALAAELNGYPGPMHVLELADRLGLAPDQRARVEALFGAMKQEAIALGERVIEAEAALDRLFASRTVTSESLAAATQAVGMAQGALRASHLRHHLATAEVLTPEQIARYDRARGYRR